MASLFRSKSSHHTEKSLSLSDKTSECQIQQQLSARQPYLPPGMQRELDVLPIVVYYYPATPCVNEPSTMSSAPTASAAGGAQRAQRA